MPTIKQSIGIAIAAMAFVAATAFGIGAVEQSALQVATNRFKLQRLIWGSMIISGSEDFWPLSGPRDKRRAPLANVIEDGPNGHLAVDQAHGRGECVARLAY